MSYGISFETPNGNVQIDSDTTNTGLIVLASAVSTATISSFDPVNEMLFAKPSSTSYTTQFIALKPTGGQAMGASGSYAFVDSSGTATNVSYIKAKYSDIQAGTGTGSSGYGVKVFNSNGDIAYDSGFYNGNGGIGIISLNAGYTLNGYGSAGGTNSKITTDATKYASMNGSFYSSNIFFGYEFKRDTGSNNDHGIYYQAEVIIFIFGTIININLPNFTPKFLAEGGSV